MRSSTTRPGRIATWGAACALSVALAGSAQASGRLGVRVPALAAVAAAGGAIDRPPEFTSSVAKAIDRGVEYLRTQQQPDGGFGMFNGQIGGQTALAYHTLRTCGVPENDPACVKAWEALKREYAEAKKAGVLRTYSAGLTMLAIADHALLLPPDRTKSKKPAPARLRDESDRTWMNELVAYMENCQAPGGGWGYGEAQTYGRGPRSDNFDHSNTQYAAQGLRAATLLGCEVKVETWRRLAEHFVRTQAPEGKEVVLVPPLGKGETGSAVRAKVRGWAYRDASAGIGQNREAPYGSMTAGSLASLVIARNELRARSSRDGALLREAESAIRSGLAWIAVHFDVASNPRHGGWHYYWLYALERAGDLADVEWIGDHDWYGAGATYLVRAQEDTGRWRETAPEAIAQSFALLFLRRAARVLESRTPGGAESPVRFDGAESLADRDFEDLVDLVVSRWQRATSDSVRGELASGAASAGARIVVPLLARMDSTDAAKRRAAHEILARATDLTFAFDPDADRETRTAALIEFEGWFLRTRRRLRFDASRGLLVDE